MAGDGDNTSAREPRRDLNSTGDEPSGEPSNNVPTSSEKTPLDTAKKSTDGGDKKRTALGGWGGNGPPIAAVYDSEEERLAELRPDTSEAALMEKRKRKAQKLISSKMEYTLNPRKVRHSSSWTDGYQLGGACMVGIYTTHSITIRISGLANLCTVVVSL